VVMLTGGCGDGDVALDLHLGCWICY
jgi:hypothetical protein